MWRLLLCLIMLAAGCTAQATAIAGALRVVPTAEGLTIRLALSEPLASPPRAFALPEPMRWAIDLPDASSTRREVAATGDAKAARVSQFDAQTVRIVVDLAQPMRLDRVFQDSGNVLELRFRPIDAPAFRALVARGRNPVPGFSAENARAVPPPVPAPDLAADSAARMDAVEQALAEAERQMEAPAATAAAPAAAPARKPQQPVAEPAKKPGAGPEPVAKARANPRRGKLVVVLDAGHGGKDVGAISVNGGHEKDVTLAIVLAAKRALEKKGGITVKLTRADDRFISLGGRVRIARDLGADLFISVHADSAPNAEARGASVYTLSEVASDREAARLAAKENRADAIAGVNLGGQDRELANLLIDLAQRDSMNASADFAQTLQQALEPKGVRFRSQFHRFAGFMVLKNLGVPAVLLETGYLSNAQDSDYLFTRKGQQAIGEGIADAAERYLKGAPRR